MRLVVDGVFFQLNSTGIARVWRTILGRLASNEGLQISLLDRGNAPTIDRIDNIPFPAYQFRESAEDSLLLQKICDHIGADVFLTTYYTTPICTPMVLMVYDMIPEKFAFDLLQREWSEKEVAICYASRYLAISHSTRSDLLSIYPEIRRDSVKVAHCGVDRDAFAVRPIAEVEEFKRRHQLVRPYFLFVGARLPHGYKNSDLFFSALKHLQHIEFDILCVGGEPDIERRILADVPSGVRIQRVSLSDYDLSLAYGGATALVYPSLYEGFGMPVVEAMACGCPVITTRLGSLSEAAGDAAYFVDGTSATEMAVALTRLRDPAVQVDLRNRGLDHSKKFSWDPMADLLIEMLEETVKSVREPGAQKFYKEWSRLRRIHADVDYL